VKDKVVIITGAGSGIGAETAKLFGKQGAKVLVTDVNLDTAQSISKTIIDSGGFSKEMALDVSSAQQVKQVIDEVMAEYGRLDVIVNNAGVGNKKMVYTAEHSLDDWDRVLSINQNGVFYCMKYALQHMDKQGFGNIVNVASLAGLKASGKCIAYSASKFAVVGMTKSAALEYASRNIRINCVCPAYTHSALLDQVLAIDPSMEQKLLKFMPMKRFGEASEIAEAILWLASEKTSFITGQALTLDGGSAL